ncbi:MAG: hypothetical protein ACRC8K_05625 [Waterburya sp.]
MSLMIPDEFLQTAHISEVDILSHELDPGEAEAIALAVELN